MCRRPSPLVGHLHDAGVLFGAKLVVVRVWRHLSRVLLLVLETIDIYIDTGARRRHAVDMLGDMTPMAVFWSALALCCTVAMSRQGRPVPEQTDPGPVNPGWRRRVASAGKNDVLSWMSLFMVFDGKIGAPTPDFDRLPKRRGVAHTLCKTSACASVSDARRADKTAHPAIAGGRFLASHRSNAAQQSSAAIPGEPCGKVAPARQEGLRQPRQTDSSPCPGRSTSDSVAIHIVNAVDRRPELVVAPIPAGTPPDHGCTHGSTRG